MMAEALQECLSCFLKKKPLDTEKKISSLWVRDMIVQFKCSKPLFTVKERFSSKTVDLL